MKAAQPKLYVPIDHPQFIVDSYVPNIVSISQAKLEEKAREADEMYTSCISCGHECKVDRTQSDYSKYGKCNLGKYAPISSYYAFYADEDCLVGTGGCGNIFFGNCNMQCMFCQNWHISQPTSPLKTVSDEKFADIMMELQNKGCNNINFVSPTHVIGPMLRALVIAKKKGLKIPLMYNTGGFDSLKTLELMDGVIDIYLPDMKYGDSKQGLKYSGTKDYPQLNQTAVKEMHRQVGNLVFNKNGIAVRGLLVRHLVLPQNVGNAELIADFLKNEISLDTYVNIMDQYRPEYKAANHKIMGRRITPLEYTSAVEYFKNIGFWRLDVKWITPQIKKSMQQHSSMW